MAVVTNWEPFEILAGPADVYVAATGATYPTDPDTDVDDNVWYFLGKTEGGVTVRHTQNITAIGVDQETVPVKVLRTEEGLEVEFSLAETTLENYSIVLNQNAVTASGDQKTLKFYQNVGVALKALLVRGRSPYGPFGADFQVPVAYQNESPEFAHTKDDKAVLHSTFVALADFNASNVNDRFGKLVATTS